MTSFSTIYDKIVTRMTALYPDHNRLPNPIAPEQNNDLILEKAWGLAIDGGARTDRSTKSTFVEYTLTFVFTRKFYAIESDSSAKADTQKSLIEDVEFLIRDIKDNELGALPDSNLVLFQNHSGIEQVRPDDDKFLMVRPIVTVEYSL